VARYRFFGRDVVSFLVVIPIALPASPPHGAELGLPGGAAHRRHQVRHPDHRYRARHVLHRRRLQQRPGPAAAHVRNLEEASADLGAHPLQTFRYVTFPAIRTALLAGGLLAFALSFDEIIVTTFTAGAGKETLPIWILQNYSRPNQGPIVNAVGLFAVLLSIIPVYLAQRLTGEEAVTQASTGGAAATA